MNASDSKNFMRILALTSIVVVIIMVFRVFRSEPRVTPKPTQPPGSPLREPPRAQTYEHTVEFNEPFILKGSEVRTIERANVYFYDNIILKDSAQLILRDVYVEHRGATLRPVTLSASAQSSIILEQAGLHTPCAPETYWNFGGRSTFHAKNIRKEFGCEPIISFTDTAQGTIDTWQNGSFAICDSAIFSLTRGTGIHLATCFPAGSRLDETFPQRPAAYTLPNTNDSGILWSIQLAHTTISEWTVGLKPKAIVTIHDSKNIMVRLDAEYPWNKRTITLENAQDGFFEDRVWNIADTRFHILKTQILGWEPNVHDNNVLYITGSVIGNSLDNDGDGILTLEHSTVQNVRAAKNAQITIRASTVGGSVQAQGAAKINLVHVQFPLQTGQKTERVIAAHGRGVITLINSPWTGQTIEEGSGRVIIQ